MFGSQGADTDAEQVALTEQLFDAALGELSVVARGQPCMIVGDFNVEPTRIPCLAKGISAGLWVDFEEAWASAAGLQPATTCKRDWGATSGHRRDFLVGCPLAVRTVFDCCRWSCRLTRVLPSGLPHGCLLLIRVRGLSRLRLGTSGRFLMIVFSSFLGRTLSG